MSTFTPAARVSRIKVSPSSAASARARDLKAAGRDIVDMTVGERDTIVDRQHGARAEDFSGCKFGRRDRRGELLEDGLSVAAEPEEQVRHEYWDEARQRLLEIDGHRLDLGIRHP